MSQVTIRNLVKLYGNYRAISNIDLDVQQGEFLVLLGPSGCGKTTTLRSVAGLEDISEGEITMAGRVVSSPGFSVPPERREIGMVFQSYAIWPHMSVAENVAFGLKMKRLPVAEIGQRVTRALDMVGLQKYADRGASQLSGGQQQRVALARAIVLEPSVLLFDEPLSNLDAKLRESMRLELRQLQQRLGLTSIYVTHDQQEAMVVADRIVLMREGKIEQIGSPPEIYHRPKSLFGAEFVGLANILTGAVESSGLGTTIRLTSGEKLQSQNTGIASGQSVHVVFRPEELIVSAAKPEGPNVFPAIITASYFLGNINDIYLRSGSLAFRSQMSPPKDFLQDQEVWIQVPPEKVVVIAG